MTQSLRDAFYAARCAHKLAVFVNDAAALAAARGAPDAELRRAIESELAIICWREGDLAAPQPDVQRSEFVSRARVVMLELGLSPWPSTSGWEPTVLPPRELDIIIGIVEGIASIAQTVASAKPDAR